MVATIAATLVEAGALNWDSKLLEIVPALQGNCKKEYENITLEQLLSNRAMIAPFEEDNSKEWKNIPKNIAQEDNQKLAFAKYALNLPPSIPEEINHVYSNGGFGIAALMLEVASGKSWEVLAKDFFQQQGLAYFQGFPSQENQNGT